VKPKLRFGIAAAVVFLLGAGLGAWTFPRARAEKTRQLMADAQRGAIAFATGELEALRGTREDLNHPAYAAVKARLISLCSVDPHVRFVYLMRRQSRGGEVIFLADSEPEDSKDISLPGDVYAEAGESYGLQSIVSSGEPQWEGPLHDSFGSWVTGYAVAARNSDGSVRDVFGIDIDATRWTSSLVAESLQAAGYLWFALGLPLTMWYVAARRHSLLTRITQLSEALDQSSAAVLMVDQRGHVTYVSGGFCRQTGRAVAATKGRHWTEFAPPDMTHRQRLRVWAKVRKGNTWHGQWMQKRVDGSTYPVFGIVSPIRDARGEPAGCICVFEDVTQLKRIEADLRAAKEQAEAANEAKSRFLATMSHEIRTPLNGIIGVASVLERLEPTPEQRELVQVIQRSGETLLVIINDILDISRIEAGKIDLEDKPFELARCIGEVAALFHSLADSKGIKLHVEHCAKLPAYASGDVARFRQILSNLVSNAVKFTEVGSVTIKTVVRDASPEAFTLQLQVADTGIGIPADKRARLFSAFSQVDASITRRFGGTGLGLVISKRLSNLMSGDISCESTPGKGSVFTVTLRLKQAQVPAPPPTAPVKFDSRTPKLGRRFKILLVEDNLVNRVVAQKMLTTLGYRPEVVTDGQMAVEACRRTAFDVVLMDLQMPTLDGISATRQIRADPQIQQPWIIALTADALIGDREKCLMAGMNDYISKPLVAAVLEDAFTRIPYPDTRPAVPV
jgi:two-component system, sensor histidine kinase and response regulator